MTTSWTYKKKFPVFCRFFPTVLKTRSSAIAIAASLLVPVETVSAHGTPQVLPLVPPASNSTQQGFVRVINRSDHAGEVSIYAIDDSGERVGAVFLSLEAGETRHFNSNDLELGNASKGLSSGVGEGEGNWRLELNSDLDFEAVTYIRTVNGFVTSMDDTVPEASPGRYRVPIFNPGTNLRQRSRLRLVNPGPRDTVVTITGLDDKAVPPPGGEVRLTLLAGKATMITAQQLESGHEGLTGHFGDGTGKWTLFVSSGQPILVMNLLLSEDGNLSNLSRSPYKPHGTPTECEIGVVIEGNEDGNNSLEMANSLGDVTGVANVRAREGTVNYVNNRYDYYMFTLASTRTIRIELRDLTQNADVYLVDAADRYLAGSDRSGTQDELIVVTLESGTYFVRVQPAIRTGIVGYQLRYSNDSVIPGRRTESAFDLGNLTSVATVRSLEGEIGYTRNETCLFRRSYYRFTLDTTRTIRIELRDLTQDADVYLVDATDRYLAGSDRSGAANEEIVVTLESGTYFIRVQPDIRTGVVGYQLRYSNDSVVPGRRTESAFDLGDVTNVGVARTVAGEVAYARNETRLFGRSYFRFTLSATRTIRIELRDLTQDADVYLVDATDRYLAGSDRSGAANEEIVVTLESGTYFIRVQPDIRTGVVGYQLRYAVVSQ